MSADFVNGTWDLALEICQQEQEDRSGHSGRDHSGGRGVST